MDHSQTYPLPCKSLSAAVNVPPEVPLIVGVGSLASAQNALPLYSNEGDAFTPPKIILAPTPIPVLLILPKSYYVRSSC